MRNRAEKVGNYPSRPTRDFSREYGVRLTLRPRVQGLFKLKPRILYLDEGGKYKSHEPEPVDITVKELGITGWLKGR